MSENHSPLRYPGGKANIINPIIEIISINNLKLCHYAEPFAGGCGLALGLLMRGYVSKISINDIDIGIWSFWNSVLYQNDKFINKLLTTNVCIDEWYRQREIVKNPNNQNTFDLGFATFFMNRTNRSGIIKAGVIGGLKQDGNYLLDCRYNKNDLSRRIERIGYYSKKINLTNLDALDFLDKIDSENQATFFCIDPPYYKQGSSLYTNFYKTDDHKALSQKISSLNNVWVLTYDNEIKIKELYSQHHQIEFNLNYFVQTKRVGTELMIFSNYLLPPKFN
jgi:DNA adenine methylase